MGEGLTIANLFVVAALGRGYQLVLTDNWAARHEVLHKYYMRIGSDPIYEKVDGKAEVLKEIAFKM